MQKKIAAPVIARTEAAPFKLLGRIGMAANIRPALPVLFFSSDRQTLKHAGYAPAHLPFRNKTVLLP